MGEMNNLINIETEWYNLDAQHSESDLGEEQKRKSRVQTGIGYSCIVPHICWHDGQSTEARDDCQSPPCRARL
jgi:hypothetical protein